MPRNKRKSDLYWYRVIREAKKCGYFTKKQKQDALNWQTCACGKQDERIPREANGIPRDYWLFDLGCLFFASVACDDFDKAKEKLDRIEERASQIIAHLPLTEK